MLSSEPRPRHFATRRIRFHRLRVQITDPRVNGFANLQYVAIRSAQILLGSGEGVGLTLGFKSCLPPKVIMNGLVYLSRVSQKIDLMNP
jgi:hypothetical protein